jgi:hypothetical protein
MPFQEPGYFLWCLQVKNFFIKGDAAKGFFLKSNGPKKPFSNNRYSSVNKMKIEKKKKPVKAHPHINICQ